MLDNRQMQEKGYSKAFRVCFDLMAKYADAAGDPEIWDGCFKEFADTSTRYVGSDLAPFVNKLLIAAYEELSRLYDVKHEANPTGKQAAPESGGYRFKLP